MYQLKKITFTCFGVGTIAVPRCIKALFIMALLTVSPSTLAYCFNDAGKHYDINPALHQAISYTESRLKADAVNNANKNKTSDYGLMQINSWWFPKLAEFGITEWHIKNEPCTNVYVGAWVLAQNFELYGKTWFAVGAYNAGASKGAEKARNRYIELVKHNYKRFNQ